MAQFSPELLTHVAKFEGGLSADPRDSASRRPSTYIMPSGTFKGLPVHTNKGVTFSTWINYMELLGIPVSSQQFINMTKTQWADIAKRLYWNVIKADQVKSQGIAEILFEAIWGGGSANLVRALQEYLKAKGYKGKNKKDLSPDGDMGTNTIYALNEYTKIKNNESDLIEYLTKKRLEYLKGLSSWASFGNGWTDRALRMKDRALAMITTTTGMTTIFFLGLVGFGYYFYNKNKR
jgi:lysozyme family protein